MRFKQWQRVLAMISRSSADNVQMDSNFEKLDKQFDLCGLLDGLRLSGIIESVHNYEF